MLSAGSVAVIPLQCLTACLFPAVMSTRSTFYSTVKDNSYRNIQPIAAVALNPKNRRKICKSSVFQPKAFHRFRFGPIFSSPFMVQINELYALVLT